MKFEKIVVGIEEANGYIFYDENSLEAVVIDPGDEAKTFMKYIDKRYLKPIGIILTHYHYDHIAAAEALKKKYQCPINAHKKEIDGLKDPEINYSKREYAKEVSITPDVLLSHGDTISVGALQLEVIHTPGHTPGSICLAVKDEKVIFTGDTVFSDALGRTDLAGGSEAMLRKTIRNKVSKWDDDVRVYPGHGESALMAQLRSRREIK
ncbi:beta-lactamase domain protein [Alkaliphilus metalliredigens QYMF]|uniref:Beta-lactamase domain protein n=1 Tax=Alkaliphilus metalliredigens (strain QYMF) TaxID=293826 RepID=A6TKP6_ALKMQ|nr:MBL fold metallo-hydrolase [Alkaliphilus metalliredigens]ABR46764.1 beta-lactamase domain protein [Alkaliphilus metalliredigens QYMF]